MSVRPSVSLERAAPTDPRGQPSWVGALQLWALWNFAVVQPLLRTLADNTTFFLYHRAGWGHALLLALLLCLPALGLFWLFENLTLKVGPRFAISCRALILFLLSGLLFVQPLKRAFVGSIWVLPLALTMALALVVAYLRVAAIRRWLTLLSIAVPIFAGLFLLAPEVRGLAAFDRGEAPRPSPGLPNGSNGSDVVLIVFDALPLATLFDADFGIDRDLFPNFARLADTSHWFRNASTTSSMTHLAVPTILTGNSPNLPGAATLTKYPNNLFTLLEASYRVEAFEPVTKLAPRPAPEILVGRRPKVMVPILSDLLVVYRHFATPEPWAAQLPKVTENWGGFVQLDQRPRRLVTALGAEPADPRGRQFERFVESIEKRQGSQLFFHHTLLPHDPTRFLPSGRLYREIVPKDGRRDLWWVDGTSVAPRRYLRHLLQVQYSDNLLGQLLDRLAAEDLLEDSVLVVCSDHGQTLGPGGGSGSRPDLRTATHPDDILRVPLFIKRPGQTSGQVDDRNVDLGDITPAIADLLGIELPWETTGHSPFATDFRHREVKRLADELGTELTFPGEFSPDLETRALWAGYFPSHYGWRRLYRFGPMPELIGRRVDDLDTVEADFAASIDDESRLTHLDAASELWPVRISGALEYAGAPTEAVLALALNGRIEMTMRGRFRQGRTFFSTLVAEEAIEAGRNRVELLVIDAESGVIRRARRVP